MNAGLIALLAVSIALGAAGQLMFKAAARSLPAFSSLGVGGTVAKLFTTPLILGAFLSFFPFESGRCVLCAEEV